jgi:RNA polymerase sigma-70 factor, ECF subfamily
MSEEHGRQDVPYVTPEGLARKAEGDEDAFDAIFRQWYAPAVRAANRILHEPGIAEELAQDVFLELWRRRDSLPAGSSIPGYVLQAVRNRALNHLRHLRVQQRSQRFVEALTDPVVQPDVDAGGRALDEAIRTAIDELRPRAREVFLMSRERHLKYGEIAAALDLSVKAVEANMSRALRQLRERLAPFLQGGGDR